LPSASDENKMRSVDESQIRGKIGRLGVKRCRRSNRLPGMVLRLREVSKGVAESGMGICSAGGSTFFTGGEGASKTRQKRKTKSGGKQKKKENKKKKVRKNRTASTR